MAGLILDFSGRVTNGLMCLAPILLLISQGLALACSEGRKDIACSYKSAGIGVVFH